MRIWNVVRVLTLQVDGAKLELPHDMEGLVILNLDSYMGGTNLWGTKSDDVSKNNR